MCGTALSNEHMIRVVLGNESDTCTICKKSIRGFFDNGVCDTCSTKYTIVVLQKHLQDESTTNPFHNIIYYLAKYVFTHFDARYKKTNEYVLTDEFMKVFKSLMFETDKNSINLGTKEGRDKMGLFVSFNQFSVDKKTIVRTCKFYANGNQAIVDCENNNRTKIIDVTGHSYEIEESGAFVLEADSEQSVKLR